MFNSKVRLVKADRNYFKGNYPFKIGYQHAYSGLPWAKGYDLLDFSSQMQYEMGRLVATALKAKRLAPVWKADVECPRDLPRLYREHCHEVIPLREKVSAER
jgi:hypothetical protein